MRTKCSPRLEFRILLIINGRQLERLIHAEPQLADSKDRFLPKFVTFRIIREEIPVAATSALTANVTPESDWTSHQRQQIVEDIFTRE